ncbi:hypothetical protein BpHYR1_004275 [Brachionus plicatilis]|uniref:Uncharacterized protein n=1 Tax=Brachionus plicatilis TaxID=10195 RepID=A0A3M7QXY0_BRAPC|nr:hypothetical protein BpHYR1_004275 [Brachionus plicatilis]
MCVKVKDAYLRLPWLWWPLWKPSTATKLSSSRLLLNRSIILKLCTCVCLVCMYGNLNFEIMITKNVLWMDDD